MLVLTIRKNGYIMVDEDIKIQIGDIQGDRVKLLIDSPRSVLTLRDKLFESTNPEQRKAMLKRLTSKKG